MSRSGNWTRTRSPIPVLTGPDVGKLCWCAQRRWINKLNEFIRLTEQSVKQERRGTITTCAYRCPEKQLTIDCVVKSSRHHKCTPASKILARLWVPGSGCRKMEAIEGDGDGWRQGQADKHMGSTDRQNLFLRTAYHQIWPPLTYHWGATSLLVR